MRSMADNIIYYFVICVRHVIQREQTGSSEVLLLLVDVRSAIVREEHLPARSSLNTGPLSKIVVPILFLFETKNIGIKD